MGPPGWVAQSRRVAGALLELEPVSVAGTRAAGAVGGAGVGVVGVVAAVSLARNPLSSWMVLISGAGNTTVVFLSTPISTRLCRLRSCNASGWAIMTSE